MSALTLYQIEDDLQALLESEEMVTPEREQEYRLQLAEQLKLAVDKRERVGQFIRSCDLMKANIKAEIERLKALSDRYDTAQDRAEAYAAFAIQQMGADTRGNYPKLVGRTIELSVARNPESVEIDDPELIPEEFKDIKQTVVIRKNDVKKALKAGRSVPGADLKCGELRLKVS